MPCTSPIAITLKRQGGNADNPNEREIGRYVHRHASPDDPTPGRFTANFGQGYHDLVRYASCGQCRTCRKRKAADATIRTFHESTLHETNLFVTLTLDPENLRFPPNPDVDYIQKFMRRIRKRIGRCRYSCLREHGKFPEHRPHFHIILFGCDPGDLVERRSQKGKLEYTSEKLHAIWGLGFIHILGVNPGTAAYAQMHNKLKITGKAAKLAYGDTVDVITGALYDRTPPSINASLKPGIGTGWYEKYSEDLWNSGYCLWQGREACIPRYYLSLMERDDPERFAQFAAERREQALLRLAKHPEENTPERRAVRDYILKARDSLHAKEDVL